MVLVLAMAVVFCAQAVRGLTGFGSALVAVPLLTALLGPRDAVPLVVALDAIGGWPLLWAVRRLVDWRVAAALLLPMLAGQWVGTALLAGLSDAWLRRIVGGVVLVFGLQRALGVGVRGATAERLPPGVAWLPGAAVAGLLGGILDGLMATSGPPLVAWLSGWLDVRRVRVQLLAVFALTSPLLLGLLWFRGVARADQAPMVGLLVLPMLIGAAAGARGAGVIAPERLARAVGVVLIFAGAMLLF